MNIACSLSHTVVVCDDNTLRVFGDNYSGELGLGHNRCQKTPQKYKHNMFVILVFFDSL
jgi:alpha-tubulin suppressor-like RCC1 family protein